jgi:O-antigen/teichoic acid export membrane protein
MDNETIGEQPSGARIARNSVILYGRLLISMAVSLYTSRIVLHALGVDDFGIFTAVGGIVMMMTVLTGALSSAIGRFITFELGKGDATRLRQIFCAAQVVQVIMAIVVVLLVETVGQWYLHTYMQEHIPLDRMEAASMMLHFLAPSFAFTLLTVPYQGTVMAHERMDAYAFISLADSFGKLGAALLLTYVLGVDRLVLYAALLTSVTLLVLLLYYNVARRCFAETHGRFTMSRPLLKEIVLFSCWNLIGNAAATLRDHGMNLLLNLFFLPVVNTARGLAMQVGSALNQFSASVITAVNPQVTKSFANGDRTYMLSLLLRGSRFAYYTVWLVSLPVLVETPAILQLWLGEVPLHTVIFVRLTIALVLVESLSGPLINVMLATGRIRNYQLVVGGLQLLNLPVSYWLLRQGLPPVAPMWTAIAISGCCLCARLLMLRKMISLPIRLFVRSVLGNILTVSLLSALPAVLLAHYCGEGIVAMFGVCLLAVAATAACIWGGCNHEERQLLRRMLNGIIGKVRKKP